MKRFCLTLYGAVIIALIFNNCHKNRVTEVPIKKADSAAITGFNLPAGEIGNTVIIPNGDLSKVVVYVQGNVDLTSITPLITVSNNATVSPASGVKVDFSGVNNPHLYTVTAQNGKTQKWHVQILREVVYKDSTVTAFFNRTEGVIANDAGNTVPLADGSVLWLLGDTYINHYDAATKTIPCLFQVRSAGLLQPPNNWDWQQTKTLLSPTGGSLFPPTASFTWPGSGVQLGDTVYVYCNNFKTTGSGSFSYTAVGPTWDKMIFPGMTVVGSQALPDFNGIGFGVSFEKADDGYVYAYGSKKLFITNIIYIARFPASNPNGPWTFWDGTGWNTDPAKLAVIGQAYSSGLDVAKVKNKYLIVSSEFSVQCNEGKHIYAGISNSRTGPFTPLKQQKVIYTIIDTLKGVYPFFYAPVIHPEFVNDKNELLITYAINGYGPCITTCVNNRFDPNTYRLRGIRLPLRLIDPSF